MGKKPMKTILDHGSSCCYLCGKTANLECHHVFGGANRKASDRYGLTVRLCHKCHNEPPHGVHHNATNQKKLQRRVQRIAMRHYKWSVEEFRLIFGKNYL